MVMHASTNHIHHSYQNRNSWYKQLYVSNFMDFILKIHPDERSSTMLITYPLKLNATKFSEVRCNSCQRLRIDKLHVCMYFMIETIYWLGKKLVLD
jgi:hypothetical protein